MTAPVATLREQALYETLKMYRAGMESSFVAPALREARARAFEDGYRVALTTIPTEPDRTLCPCKDRPVADCPGEWEQGCDLGANERYVVALPPLPGGHIWTVLPLVPLFTAAEMEDYALAALSSCPTEPDRNAARLDLYNELAEALGCDYMDSHAGRIDRATRACAALAARATTKD